MFQTAKPRSTLYSIMTILELVYHSVVRDVRKSHGNAIIALATNILQAVIMVLAFYLFFAVLGLKGAKLRGDFMLYMMSGIFMYLTHIKAMGAVVGAEGPTSPMMQHAPLNTIISILAAAIGALYLQVLSLVVVLFLYYVVFQHYTIDQPIPAFGMFLLAWGSGVAVGLVLLAIKPWFPGFVALFRTIYMRANMIASGKMFVANTLPPTMLAMFDWNPLFHIIDQCRGFVFNNYFPHKSDMNYPIYVMIVLVVIGLMAEFYTRQYASSSWSARR